MRLVAASIASRVFPVPPGPISDTSRDPFLTIVVISSISDRLPTNVDGSRGRLVFEIVRRGGWEPAPTW